MGKKEDRYNRRRLKMAYISSVVSISLVLFVLGLVGIILISANQLSAYVKEHLKVQVMLQNTVSEADMLAMETALKLESYVKSVNLIDPEEARQEFMEAYGEDFMDFLDVNPLQSTIEITLHAAYANNDSIAHIEASLLNTYSAQIQQVYRNTSLINEVNKNAQKLGFVLLGISGLLLIIMIALINNTIRLSIYAKRFLIKTMQLVGATPSFIRQPFIVSGLVQGIIASIIAIILLAGSLFIGTRYFPGTFTVDDYAQFGILFLGVIGLGLLLTLISTYLAVRKFLRLKVEELY